MTLFMTQEQAAAYLGINVKKFRSMKVPCKEYGSGKSRKFYLRSDVEQAKKKGASC